MAQAVAIGTGNRLFIPTAQASPFADSRARTGQNPDPEMISAAAAASLLLLTGAHGRSHRASNSGSCACQRHNTPRNADRPEGRVYGRVTGRCLRPPVPHRLHQVDLLAPGGECVTERRCKPAAASSPLGSSKFFKKNYTFWGDSTTHFIDASCTGNPTLCDYNMVYMPYCSQDLWTGQRTTVGPDTWGLYFSGRWIIKAVMDLLSATHDLKGASEVILSGNSAGGVSKSDEFCIKNEELCIKDDELCILK